MEVVTITELSQKRFDALAGHARTPAAAFVSNELAWYKNSDETVIATLLLDIIDNDYAVIILARDEGRRFRCIDLTVSIKTEKEAREWLFNALKWHSSVGVKNFTQGDIGKGTDLFSPIVSIEKQHPYFVKLNSDDSFFAAKSIINEMMPHFIDIDGNFVEQFQSSGFDSRLWEMYLNAYIKEEQIFVDRNFHAPDFLVTKYGKSVAIEAVTVGRKKENPPKYFKYKSDFKDPDEIQNEHENLMPIRFGSPLYSKLKKEYWNLNHVQGLPLVFAIADFHDDMSMLWSSSSLIFYLYGYKYNHHYDENNELVITPVKIENHKDGEKEIPSGFFFQPNAENISAVMFSSIGTISKFNRLGRQAGFKKDNIRMFRRGTCHDHNKNASVPKMFSYEVDENSNETWGEGLSMYHNPNALHPIPEELFPSIAHHYFDDGQIVSHLPEFYPYASFTLNMKIQK
ncbi:hypothetical protein [uncultured Desulfuromusa sp.]|uniref:hypothetical protein n=1 Tax=uncultured Desulfuromusa sp. TaxID=219183 RepID=UPI002AA6CB8B|nr:hypothetical protein [uncultured Desulfuromusa sp.]